MRGTPCNFWEGNSINNTKGNKYKALPQDEQSSLLLFALSASRVRFINSIFEPDIVNKWFIFLICIAAGDTNLLSW